MRINLIMLFGCLGCAVVAAEERRKKITDNKVRLEILCEFHGLSSLPSCIK
jgi:hypothetical protein